MSGAVDIEWSVGLGSGMGDVVNLNTVRKAKAKAERAALSAQNRTRHGRTKTERDAAEAKERKASERLAGHRLPDPDET